MNERETEIDALSRQKMKEFLSESAQFRCLEKGTCLMGLARRGFSTTEHNTAALYDGSKKAPTVATALICLTASAAHPQLSDQLPGKLLLTPPQDDMNKRLSRDQVKGCMKRAAEITEHDKTLVEPGKKIEQEKQALEANSATLKNAQRTLNRSNRAAVDAFNKKVNEFNEARKHSTPWLAPSMLHAEKVRR